MFISVTGTSSDVLRAAHNTPVIVVLFTGSALDISFADADHRVSAILECFLPAQATGVALRHALLNDVAGAVPAGRLPFTWYKTEQDVSMLVILHTSILQVIS